MTSLGKILLIAGAGLILLGLLFLLAGTVPFLGHLPGDIRYESDGTKVSIPLTTCILMSIILTVLLNLVFRLLGK